MPSTPGQPCSTSDARLIGTDEPDVTDEEINAILNTDDHPMPSYEPKSEDWGRRANGRVVILDYGYGCDNEAEINAQREYYSPFPPQTRVAGTRGTSMPIERPLAVADGLVGRPADLRWTCRQWRRRKQTPY